MTQVSMRRRYAIHPAIGIARVGDSPDEYFIGPEAPGVLASLTKPDSPGASDGKYKDHQKRIKRQGARFRVYEYTHDDTNAVAQVREITTTDADIDWEVHLANRKAAAPRFDEAGRRNDGVPEASLIIDTGKHKIGGASRSMQRLEGRFMNSADVRLGDLLTDSAGRLIVLGGLGVSFSVPPGKPLRHFANNDAWCDDTSDGPVRAFVRLHDSPDTVEADPAWVIVAPPDFAPPIPNVITLYDIVYNMMANFDSSLAVGDTTEISFTRDIYPILWRVSNMHWVSEAAAAVHGPGGPAHFLSRLHELSSNEAQHASLRRFIFRKLRNPAGGGGNMPKLPASTENQAIAALTPVQYKRMERWAEGRFDADWKGQEPSPLPLDQLIATDRPHAVNRAALEACVGAGMFPGIEVGRMMLEEATYDKSRPFRINRKLPPGALTATMAVPWQADFFFCTLEAGMDWWPGQRPNKVLRRGSRELTDWVPREWKTPERMVSDWSNLGFVVREEGTDRFVEEERFL